jgi:CHAT domain-containing protein/Flp pilus assembly protein TadD
MIFICALLLLFGTLFVEAAPPTLEEQLSEAESAYANRNFQDAVKKFAPLLKHFQQAEDDQKVADIEFKMGRSNRRLGNYDAAIKLLNDALKLHTKIGDQKGLGFDLTEIGVAHQRQGNYEEALTWSNKAITVHEEIQNFVGIAKTNDTFAQVYYRKGDLDQALLYGEKSLAAAQKGDDREFLGVVYSNLGQTYYNSGDHARALECYKNGREIAEEIHDLNGMATNLANSALVYWDQGELNQAAEDLENAGAIFKEVGNRPLLANNFFNLAYIELEKGNYTKALESFHQAYSMAKKLDDKGLAAAALHGTADVEQELGNYESALLHVEQSLQLSKQIGEKSGESESLLTLGSISSNQGKNRSALEYFKKALQLDREAGYQRTIHMRLRAIGAAYAKMGNLDLAIETMKEAILLEEQSSQKFEMSMSLSVLGSIYRQKKDFDAANAALDQSMELAKDSGNSYYRWSTFYNKGLIARDLGINGEAEDWLKKAVEEIERQRERAGLPEQRSAFLENRLDVYEDLIAFLIRAGKPSDAYQYAQRSKSRSFLDSLSEARIDPQAGMDSKQYNAKRRLLAKLLRLNQQIKKEREQEKPDPNKIQQLTKTQTDIEQEYVRLLSEIRQQNPRFAEIQQPRIYSLTEAQTLLDSQSVLLDYFVGKKESYVFAITGSGYQLYSLPPEIKLNPQVQEILKTLQKPEPVWETTEAAHSHYIKAARNLYAQVLQTSESVWREKKQIIIAADGPLNYLPFETLLTSKVETAKIDFSKLPYFALNHEVQYVPSISAFSAILQNVAASHEKPERDWIAFADPLGKDLNAQKGTGNPVVRKWNSSLTALPYARAEVDAISKMYPKEKTSILFGKDASESNAKTMNLESFDTIHFASHGLIDEERPQLSSVVLNAGSPQEDGYLTMREVFDLKLNADLVVLSACKTGLGKKIRGEGVSSLARAFFCAGAASVLVSLWNVNDHSTSEFMTDFYRNRLERKMTKTEALKEARVKMIHSSKYSHPYYWSPFILIGSR